MASIRSQAIVFSLVLALGGACRAGAEETSASPSPALPPGMTPAIMKMMMTPGKPNPKGLPPGMTSVSGCIPTMGFHYARGKNFPFGPIYGYYRGKPVFIEVMPTVAQFNAGFNTNDIKARPGYKIDHIDSWYEKNGQPGLTVPHYDIHAYYVSHAEHMKYCQNPSGTRPPVPIKTRDDAFPRRLVSLVEMWRLELQTPYMRSKCSTN